MGTKLTPSTKKLQSFIFNFPLYTKDTSIFEGENIPIFYPQKDNNYVTVDRFCKMIQEHRIMKCVVKGSLGLTSVLKDSQVLVQIKKLCLRSAKD